MYDVVLGLTKILAPFIPFITENMYQNLKTDDMPESVHLCDYIEPDKKQIDNKLEEGMEHIRELVEAGRALRSKVGIKVRYPLSSATLVCDKKIEDLIKNLLELLNEEINVKKISFERDTSKFMIKSLKPKHSSIGKRLKEKAKLVVSKLEEMDEEKLYTALMKDKKVELKIDGEKIVLTVEDFEIVEKEKPDIARTDVEGTVLLINTRLNSELEAEGFAREIVRRIQSMRKEMDLDVEDKITTELKIDSEKVKALQKWEGYIKGETRSKTLAFKDKPSGKLVRKWDIDQVSVEIGVTK